MNANNRLVSGHGLGDKLLTVTDHELLAARLTAYALGDLDSAEAAEIERMLAEPARADERRQVEEVRRVAAALKAGRSEAEGTRSADLRRAVVAAATAPRPKWSADIPEITFPPVVHIPPVARTARRSPWGGLATLGTLAAAMLVAVTLLPVRQQAERRAPRQQPMPQADNAAPQDAVAKSAIRERSSPPVPAAPARPTESAAPVGSLARSFERFEADGAPAPRGIVGMPAPRMESDREGAEMLSRGEGYATVVETRFIAPRDQPLSTFSIDVDTASYANVRRFLIGGRRPPRDAVLAAATPFFNWLVMARGYNVRCDQASPRRSGAPPWRGRRGRSRMRIKGTCR